MLGRADFEAIYAHEADPWGLEERWYERRKRALTLAALPRARYGSALEVGCGPGLLTELLAERCAGLLALDSVEPAVRRARARLDDRAGVEVRVTAVPEEWPDGRFDLVVAAEVLYYLSRERLQLLIARCLGSLEPQGELVAVHWRHPVERHALGGVEVHRILQRTPRLGHLAHHREADFILDVFTRLETSEAVRSVAQRTSVPGAEAPAPGPSP